MAICFVPAQSPQAADGDDYTYQPPRLNRYDLRPAPMRQAAEIAEMQRQIADLIARIARLEEIAGVAIPAAERATWD